jgi:hypothetical protein
MPYTAEISRGNPSCFLFLIDQSKSMAGPFGGAASNRKKADGLADAINRLLQTLVLRCAKSEGVRDYYHVSVIGYGSQVGPALGGALAGRKLVPVSQLASCPIRVETRTRHVDDGAGGVFEQSFKFPIWFDPTANGKTPMCGALDLAWTILNEFVMQFPNCYPPMVINITDGAATDGDPEPHAQMLRNLASSDGNVLLFNLHLSSSAARPVEFPDREEGLPDDFARRLFRMSSRLPPGLLAVAQQEGFAVNPNSCGFVFNADLVSLIRFLNIGTMVDTSRLR